MRIILRDIIEVYFIISIPQFLLVKMYLAKNRKPLGDKRVDHNKV